mgnify:CR=1 FL=1
MTNEKSESKHPLQWPSGLQLGLSMLAAMLLLSLAGLALLGALGGLIFQSLDIAEVTASLMTGIALFAASLILLLSSALAFQRMRSKSISWPWLSKLTSFLKMRAGWLAVGFLVVGALVGQSETLSLVALPPIHTLTVLLIALGLFMRAARDIQVGSPQRVFGVFTSGMVLAPAISMVLEIIAGILLVVIGLLYISLQPAHVGLMEQLGSMDIGLLTEAEYLDVINPLVQDPVLVGLILLFIAFLVPLIEELLKPIGLYFSMNRDWSPASGFALGALSGAGFGLFENLALTAGRAEWLGLIGARVGTTAIHMLASGIIGWGLVRAKNEKRYLGLFWAYLTSVVLHGVWNGLTLMAAMGAINPDSIFAPPKVIFGIVFGLFILGLGSIFVLGLNRRRLLAASQTSD